MTDRPQGERPPGRTEPASEVGSGAPEPAAEPGAGAADLGRRRFFRTFATDIVQTAATAVGAVSALQRAASEAAGAILDPVSAADRVGSGAGAAAAPGTPGSVAPPPALAGARTTADLEEEARTRGMRAALDDVALDPALNGPTGFRTAFRLEDGRILFVDQRKLPSKLEEVACETGPEVARAIVEMVVRGAPAIGQAAAYGVALSAHRARTSRDPATRRAMIQAAATALWTARPTAVNLAWAVGRMLARAEALGGLEIDPDLLADGLRAEADAICFEATRDHSLLAEHGLAVLPRFADRPIRVLTHCNTGPLACGQFGTALGVVQAAVHAGIPIEVFVDETRPYLQGARLTAWELAQAGVPYTLIADVAAGSLLAAGRVDAVLVGADRVVANGDTANKVGTYPLAVLAARHGIPFYVCAPLSSVDLATPGGTGIPIEERDRNEVLSIQGVRIAPPLARAWNPAFDVTPAELIGGIVTEMGVLRPPFERSLAEATQAKRASDAPTPAFAGFAADGDPRPAPAAAPDPSGLTGTAAPRSEAPA